MMLINSAKDVLVNALNAEEDQLSPTDIQDQAARIDANRECMGRIVEEFYNAGFLTVDAVARMSGLSIEDVEGVKS